MPGPASERATLSRDLADFLIELSIALHKHAMYPEGHPSLAPAAAGVTRRAALLLEDRATVCLGSALNQPVMLGVHNHPNHPVPRELASRPPWRRRRKTPALRSPSRLSSHRRSTSTRKRRPPGTIK